MLRLPLVLCFTASILAVCSCNSGDSSSPPPETLTGRTPILPQRKLLVRMRELATGSNESAQSGVDLVHLAATASATARVGDLVRVELMMNAGTGFEWKCTSCVNTPDSTGQATSALMVLTPKFDLTKGLGNCSPTTTGTTGGPVRCDFEFTATQIGSSSATFELARPWEKGVAPVDTRTLTVHVTAAGGS